MSIAYHKHNEFRLILWGIWLCFVAMPMVNGQERFTERLDYFRSVGQKGEIEIEEIRTPLVSHQAIIDSITQRILTEEQGFIVYPAELGNAFTFVSNPDANQTIFRLGYLQTPSSLLPDQVAQCAYTPWLFGNELLTVSKNKDNAEALGRFFSGSPRPIKMSQALWYYFSPKEPEQKLPFPVADNMYFFKGESGDLDKIQALLSSYKQGYIICPVWTEDVTGVLDNEDDNPFIRGSGTIEFFVKESPLSIALNITPWEEDAVHFKETDRMPFVYDTTYTRVVKDWLLSIRELRPFTIRSFFCYFDKRGKDEVALQKQEKDCVIPVFKEDGRTTEKGELSGRLSKYNSRAFPIVPYWMQSVYEQLSPALIRRFGRLAYLGYVIDSSDGQANQVCDWQKQSGLLDIPAYADTPFDLMVFFRNSEVTNRFLASEEARSSLLTKLFASETGTINRDPSLRKFNGLTLCFPDFDFKLKNKRNLVQFVKSISFVIDSFCVDGHKPYEKYALNISFPIEAKKHLGYLSVLLKYKLVNRICFVEYDDMGVPVASYDGLSGLQDLSRKIAVYEDDCEVSWFDHLFNTLFYLLKPFVNNEQQTGCSTDLDILAHTEFSDPMLDFLVLCDMLLFVVLVVLVVLYFTSSKFYMLVWHYDRYALPVLLVLISEILLILILMANIVSTHETYDRWTQLFLLVLPLIFFLLAIVPMKRRDREPLP